MTLRDTTKSKAKRRRQLVRQLLPHVDEAVVIELAAIDDPLERFDAVVVTAHATGSSQSTIDRCERHRWEALRSVLGPAAAAQWLYDRQAAQPDDRRFRPAHVDSVLRGPARATGQTAVTVRRRSTVTQWQHEQNERRADRG